MSTKESGNPDGRRSARELVAAALTAKQRTIWLLATFIAIASLIVLVTFDSLNAFLQAKYHLVLSTIWKELSLHLFTDSVALILIGFYYERYVRQENTSLVLQQFLDTEIILRDLSENKVAEIGKAALSRIFDDGDFGSDLFSMLQTRVRRTNERAYDYTSRITLRVPAPPDLAAEYFEVITVTSYSKVIRQSTLDFMITDDLETWEDTMTDRKVELCYLLRKADVSAPRMPYDDSVFNVTNVWLDDERLDIAKQSRNGDNYFSARIPDKFRSSPSRVSLRYIFKTLIRRSGHQFSQGPVVPVKGATMSLNVAQVPIASFSMVPFFTSANKPMFVNVPPDNPYERQVSVEGWVLPRSGATWIWSLKGEAPCLTSASMRTEPRMREDDNSDEVA